MYKVLILGSGKIGGAIARMLHYSGDYEVMVADRSEASLKRLAQSLPIQTKVLDVRKTEELVDELRGWERVVSACPFSVNPGIAQAALEAGVSYFDLTEDVATTRAVRTLAVQAEEGQVFMPQCGLAPGFISILANHLCSRFDRLRDVKMRVGALPQYPSNMLMYNLTWSTDGLINEYCNPCEAIEQGRQIEVPPLEGLELFSLDGINYEAFNTSGGLGTLCESLQDKVARSLNYKTVRYKGHRHLISFLIRDLHLGERRDLLKDILEHAIPITYQDVVLIFCTVSGWINGRLVQQSDARKIYSRILFDERMSSIQITTACGMCAVVDLHAHGDLPTSGFLKQEWVPYEKFINNRFGMYYSDIAEPLDQAPNYNGDNVEEEKEEE